MKKKIAVFDFDGTLTRKDTLLEFIKYSCGKRRFYWGMLLHIPFIFLMKTGLYANWKVKQKVLCFFFGGWLYEDFASSGKAFSIEIDKMLNERGMTLLRRQLDEADRVYVVSASVEEWVVPWCKSHGIDRVLATSIEVKEGRLTGKLCSKNCYGKEKVSRLLQVEPDRENYNLYAVGDSRGDDDMLAFADKGERV